MHELNPADAQRIDRREDRPLYVGLLRAACTANACKSGRAQCPCPDACRVPEGSRMAAVWRLLDRIEPGQFWIGYAAFVALAIGGLCLAFR